MRPAKIVIINLYYGYWILVMVFAFFVKYARSLTKILFVNTNVYKTVIGVIDGVERIFMTELHEYNHCMNLTNQLYESLAKKEKKQEDIGR